MTELTNERAAPELLPCPMCGCTNIGQAAYEEDNLRDFVMCNGCGLMAQRCDTDADPVEVWNRRATPSSECTLPPLPRPDIGVGALLDGPACEPFYNRQTVEQIRREAVEADRRARPQALNNAEAAQWARDHGLNVPPQWEAIQQPASAAQGLKPLTRCAAGRDGDCSHPMCPQARDGEPHKSQRHCLLDTLEDEE